MNTTYTCSTSPAPERHQTREGPSENNPSCPAVTPEADLNNTSADVTPPPPTDGRETGAPGVQTVVPPGHQPPEHQPTDDLIPRKEVSDIREAAVEISTLKLEAAEQRITEACKHRNEKRETAVSAGCVALGHAGHIGNPTTGTTPPDAQPPLPGGEGTPPWETMNGKPVIYRDAKTVLNLESDQFHEKLLCDGLTFNLGDACGFSCRYCYVESVILKLVDAPIKAFNAAHGTTFGFQDVVIRRRGAMDALRSQLLFSDGTPKFNDPKDQRVVYTATLVDPAANKELLRETAETCNMILAHTNWQIRILSKSASVVKLVQDGLIPEEFHHRIIIGLSIGTLNDKIARAIEPGTSSPTARIKALHWLQDHGIRTFGMICPSLPQEDYDKFSKEICEAIRIEKCEHVWAEVINLRGKNLTNTVAALEKADLTVEAELLKRVCTGADADAAWEQYARATFEAHQHHVPPAKLRFLQYVNMDSASWWGERRNVGAVPIGKEAMLRGVLAGGESAPSADLPELTAEDLGYRTERESLVSASVTASINAAQALRDIHSYRNGILWRRDYLSFDDYCKRKWGYEKAHAYRLVKAGKFVGRLESGGDDAPLPLPRNEAQIRPLLSLIPEDHQKECWGEIVEKFDPENLTGDMVEKMAKKYAQKNQLIPASPPRAPRTTKATPQGRALAALQRLREVLDDLPDSLQYNQLLTGIEMLLGQQHDGDLIDVPVTVIPIDRERTPAAEPDDSAAIMYPEGDLAQPA